MLAFLIGTKTGHALIALALMLMAGGLCYWRGHSHGWNDATTHYRVVVDSALAANATQERTIAQLQAANDQWADLAKVDAAKLSQAAEQVALAKAANAKALADARARLHSIEASHGDAHAWSVTHVPDSVLDALGLRNADRSH